MSFFRDCVRVAKKYLTYQKYNCNSKTSQLSIDQKQCFKIEVEEPFRNKFLFVTCDVFIISFATDITF